MSGAADSSPYVRDPAAYLARWRRNARECARRAAEAEAAGDHGRAALWRLRAKSWRALARAERWRVRSAA